MLAALLEAWASIDALEHASYFEIVISGFQQCVSPFSIIKNEIEPVFLSVYRPEYKPKGYSMI